MKKRSFDPDERARQKAASRERDERALASGAVTWEELQHINGGYGMFRKSVFVRPRRSKRDGSDEGWRALRAGFGAQRANR